MAQTGRTGQADAIRIAFWRVDLHTRGPGEALAQIRDRRPNAAALAQVIATLSPDIMVLSGVDYDMQGHTLSALRDLVAEAGVTFPHLFAPQPNAGFDSGLDLNRDGRAHGPDDAHGHGDYAGERALAVMSRHKLNLPKLRDFTGFLWRDLPDALLYGGMGPALAGHHRLSSVAHFELPVTLPGGRELALLIYQAGPPVFGDHPDRNRNRNHDETAFWTRLLEGALPVPPPPASFVLIGGSNLDPFDGDGRNSAMRDLLAHPALQDPRPASPGGAAHADPNHNGPPHLDTVAWDTEQGNLRVSYILPSAKLTVTGAGVLWPLADDPLDAVLAETGTLHKPVWVDIAVN
ncbi:endonuclease/exonuclease/phosphatase family protein [Roseibaca sp. Y0-43]|uniref:endonuclease/exonuclease/phosphatase family protein n=1 Tax=Roseibaca sp. Y0-43 TaxID=2816854 RepID=UPI001D0C3089